MSLFADNDGTVAAIEFDEAAGWYLYLTLPSGETRDYLQDTLEITIQQAEEEFGIPSTAWEERPSLNRDWIIRDLTEALEELLKTIADVKNPTYGEGQFVVAMSHAYHHINTAWNARFASDEEHKECSQKNFDAWRKFPKDHELLLE